MKSGQTLLAGFAQNFHLYHKDYLNDSIRSSSQDEESVAEERDSMATVHQSKTNEHQTLNSQLDFHKHLDESKEEEEGMQFCMDLAMAAESYYNEEAKDGTQGGSPRESIDQSSRQNSGGSVLKNVKFILFKSQNVVKKHVDKKSAHQGHASKTPKLKVTQRSRMGNHKDEYYPQSNQYSSLSNSANNSRLQQSHTIGANAPAQQNNSSSSQAMTNSRDQQSNDLKSQLTTDNISTKHTFDHQSQKSGGLNHATNKYLIKKQSQEEA